MIDFKSIILFSCVIPVKKFGGKKKSKQHRHHMHHASAWIKPQHLITKMFLDMWWEVQHVVDICVAFEEW